MLRWIWIAPIVLLAGCSHSTPPAPVAANAASNTPPPAVSGESPVAAVSPFGTDGQPAPNPPASDQTAEAQPAPERELPPAAPMATALEIPAGTRLHVRLDDGVSTARNRAGDPFHATLVEPVVMEGRTVLPRGTRFHGHLTSSRASGRLKGRAFLALTLDGFQLQGRDYRIATSRVDRVSAAHKKRNAVLIGGGAALGAAIGALAGGGKGAAIGAGAGGGAGLAGAAITGKREVGVPAEAPLTFVLESPVRV